MSEFIGTRSGCKINLDDPQPDDFILDDIAIGLSHVARFNGQTDWHYSVAQHSVLVARYLLARYNDTTLALQGLLHDASESVICDLPTPVKRFIGQVYYDLETRVQHAILAKFSVPTEFSPAVHDADLRALIAERNALQPQHCDWGKEYDDIHPLPYEIEPWAPEFAKQQFLSLFHHLTEGRYSND